VSTFNLELIINGVTDLAGIAAVWSLIYFRRILLAASPKPQAVPQDKPEKKTETPPAPEADETAPLPKVKAVAS